LLADLWLSSPSAPLTSYLYPGTGPHRSQSLKTLPPEYSSSEDALPERIMREDTYLHLYAAYTRLTMLCQQEVKSSERWLIIKAEDSPRWGRLRKTKDRTQR
jgi:hypothetical protein